MNVTRCFVVWDVRLIPLWIWLQWLWQLAWVSITKTLQKVRAMINSTLENIEAVALQLTQADRAHLAERLLSSLDEDDEILAAWVEEAERRGDAFDRGEMDAVDFDVAISQARARITRRHAA